MTTICTCGNPCFKEERKCPECTVNIKIRLPSSLYDDIYFLTKTKKRFKLAFCEKFTFQQVEGWKCLRCGCVLLFEKNYDPCYRITMHSDGRRKHLTECDSWGFGQLQTQDDHVCSVHEKIKPYLHGLDISEWGPVILHNGNFHHLVRMGMNDHKFFRCISSFHETHPEIDPKWTNSILCNGCLEFST